MTVPTLKINDPTSLAPERCDACRFWAVRDDNPASDTGNCRRYPPVLDVLQITLAQANGHTDDGEDFAAMNEFADMNTYWWSQPCTNNDGWCGEWKPILA